MGGEGAHEGGGGYSDKAFLLKLAGGVGGAVQASLPLAWFFVACSLWTRLGR